jgi:hypothetical protein
MTFDIRLTSDPLGVSVHHRWTIVQPRHTEEADVTTSTYAPPFLQNLGGQPQVPPWQQSVYGQLGQFSPTGIEQFPGFGQGQQPFGQYGQGQPFGAGFMGSFGSGPEQVVPSLLVIVQLLGNAQQALWTAQHVAAQLPAYIATAVAQPYHQLAQQRQFSQPQRPYSMVW